jgi:lysyl endopeptidase
MLEPFNTAFSRAATEAVFLFRGGWMMRSRTYLAVFFLALLATTLPAQAWTRIWAGDERAWEASTPAEYPRGDAGRPVTWSETVVSPGARFLRIHFSKLDLPDGDFLTVTGLNGRDSWVYTGKGLNGTGSFWSFAVEDEAAVIELHSSNVERREKGWGFAIDRIAHGEVPLAIEPTPAKVVCGTDGRQNAVCHSGINTSPVARMLFQSGGSSFVCTGWLATGSNANTFVTNNHCISTQTEASSLQAKFNYQITTCTGTTQATTTDYAGGTLLKTNNKLDYTVMTLQGNPEATWGEYTPTRKQPTAGLVINFPQHPGGGLKEIGYWEDAAQTVRCSVAGVNQTYSGTTRKSQMSYGCDSEGGSSGSPIMDAGTGRIIGLHHYGGISNNPCLNAATQMIQVCADAGALLSCATN